MSVDEGSPPSVSIVVPVRNEAPYLDACLRALVQQDYPRQLLEVIVVDGRSTDATLEKAREWSARDSRIRLIDNPDAGMPSGLNLGIAAARGELIGAMSGHSAAPPDYVLRAARALQETGAWSVGGKIRRIARTATGRAIARATSSTVGVGDAIHNYAQVPGWVETVFPGFWPRWVFDRVGQFDPSMLANEDNEFSYRIRQAGGRIWYDPAIVVNYAPRETLRSLFRQYFNYARGKARVLAKHRGGLRWRHLVPTTWLIAVLALPPLALIWPATLAAWVVVVAMYAAVVAAAAARLGDSETRVQLVAAAIVTLHVAYGLGLLAGVVELALGLQLREPAP